MLFQWLSIMGRVWMVLPLNTFALCTYLFAMTFYTLETLFCWSPYFHLVGKLPRLYLLKNASHSICDFRPISILPICSKVVENVIISQMLSYLEWRSLLDYSLGGFRNKRSTTSLMLFLTDSIGKNYVDGKCSILLSLDLEKAFDRVDYSTLLVKLFDLYGFSSSACSFLMSFLTGRHQMVYCGVPQGSVISPLLIIYLFK